MLSYRHSFHAGNHADLVKHLTEIAVLQYLKKKDKPFVYHDTHAAAGLYSLYGEHAQKTAEYQTGIGKLWQAALQHPLLQQYRALVQSVNPSDELAFYPGSPLFAKLLCRDSDHIQATELHPADYPLLAEHFANRRYSRIEKMDAWAGIRAMLPPLVKRGLVLIDPPYELKTEYQDVLKGLTQAMQRFPQATYAIWYPVIERDSIEAFLQAFIATGWRNQLRIELLVKPDSPGFGMTGSGMWLINPPYTVAADVQAALTEVQPLLGPDCQVIVRQEVAE